MALKTKQYRNEEVTASVAQSRASCSLLTCFAHLGQASNNLATQAAQKGCIRSEVPNEEKPGIGDMAAWEISPVADQPNEFRHSIPPAILQSCHLAILLASYVVASLPS